MVIDIRRFASEHLALPENDSYTEYADLDRDFVIWNVFATPELSLARIIHRMFWSTGFCARKWFHICQGKRVCRAGFPALASEFVGFIFGVTGRYAA